MLKGLGVLASGRGTNLEAIMAAIERGDLAARVAVVVSDAPDAAALGRARSRGVPAVAVNPSGHPTRREFETTLVRTLRENGADVVILAGFMRLLGKTFLEAYQGQTLNIHPSLLPTFPGLEAQRQALDAGVKVSGCTVHYVDHGMDTGPIIAQRSVPVREDDTVETLSARILAQEHDLYWRAIALHLQGRLVIVGRRVKVLSEAE